jgi:hypothetical protein
LLLPVRLFTAVSRKPLESLLNKEDELGQLAERFAVFLDTLKDWGGRAIVDIPPGRPPIARFIAKPRAAE